MVSGFPQKDSQEEARMSFMAWSQSLTLSFSQYTIAYTGRHCLVWEVSTQKSEYLEARKTGDHFRDRLPQYLYLFLYLYFDIILSMHVSIN